MRRDRALAGLAAALCAVLCGLLLLATNAGAQDANLLRGRIDAEFDAGAAGWSTTGGTLRTSGGVGHASSAAAGPLIIDSDWWRVPTAPGAAHTLQLSVGADVALSDIHVGLAFRSADGTTLGPPAVAIVTATGSQLAPVTLGPTTSPPGTAFAQVTLRATAAAASATLLLDSVALTREAAPPIPTAPAGAQLPAPTESPTPAATAPPTPTLSPTATARAAATARATATTRATSASALQPALRNGGFEDGLDPWTHTGGTLELTTGLEGTRAALLISASESTKWLQQAVTVNADAWYAARARVKLGPRVDAAWLRLAWYATADASGAQLDIADSAPLTGDPGTTATLETGPALAPPDARSARVRVLLRPASVETATIVVDAVELTPAQPDVTPPRAPPSAPGASGAAAQRVAPPVDAPATAPPRTNPAARPEASTTQAHVAPAPPERGEALNADASRLRITELLPDPEPAGNDADFEWVELSNLGAHAVPLAGFILRDNRADTPLPDRDLPPGASLVIAAPRAAVPRDGSVLVHALPGSIGNGLGNAGDRLALVAPDGALMDRLSWGSDATYDDPPLLAPAPGESLRRYFADDGSLLAVQLAIDPSPGRLESPPAAAARGPNVAREAIELLPPDSGQRQVWALLAATSSAAVLALAWQRVRAARR